MPWVLHVRLIAIILISKRRIRSLPMSRIYQRKTNICTRGVNGALSSSGFQRLNDSVIVLAAAKRHIRSCERIQTASGMKTTKLRTREEVIKRLGLITESLQRQGTENALLMKIAAIHELEWVLEIREK